MALLESQALLHCAPKAALYTVEMTLGKRIKAARERLRPDMTQAHVGTHFGVTPQAVSGWERDDSIPELDKIADLAELLKVPCVWLLKGAGEPPAPDALEAKIDGLRPSERAIVDATIEAIRRQRDNVA
jgi:transcriptional regulator with XRE-family HTH domain